MNAIDYEILKAICTNNVKNQRSLSQITGFSLGKINKSISLLKKSGYLDVNLQPTATTEALIDTLKPRSAIILAAGRGLRMIPLCKDVSKALLEVNGEILIERLIQQLHDVGVFEIYVVVGYKKELFEYLIDKYHVNLVVNPHFDNRNNLFSLSLTSRHIHNSYIIPCDLYCHENPFSTIETYSWYMVASQENAKSSFSINRNHELIAACTGQDSAKEIGIAYIGMDQAEYVAARIAELQKPENYTAPWTISTMEGKKSVLSAKIVIPESIHEINTYDDLVQIDPYSESLNSEYINIICQSLKIEREDISHVKAQKAGMTNQSFLFECKGNQYIFRIPGEGTNQLINRRQEYNVYQQIKNKNLCDEIVYINPENGYKITKYMDCARNCHPQNLAEVEMCMQSLRNFHEMNLSVDHHFDIFEQILYYEKIRNCPSVYADYDKTKQSVFQLKRYIDNQKKRKCLCHIDSVYDNFIFSNGHIYLIDWEYAGMQDPHVDIAMFAIYALYDKAHVDMLIDFYFQNTCDQSTRLKIYCYIAACGLLWSNWCEYKASLGETFGEYSLCQYRYAKDFYRLVKEELSIE